MNQQEAYDYGLSVGYGIGECNIVDFSDFDAYFSECLQTECEHFRQFSPFEFYANDFNATEREEHYYRTRNKGTEYEIQVNYTRMVKQCPDKMWESYETGVSKGLEKAWKELH